MANKVQFSNNNIDGSISKGEFRLVTNDIMASPSHDSGFNVGVNPPIGGYTLYIKREGFVDSGLTLFIDPNNGSSYRPDLSGTGIWDLSGNNSDGYLANGLHNNFNTYNNYNRYNYFRLDGTNDYIDIDNWDNTSPTNKYTFCMWVRNINSLNNMMMGFHSYDVFHNSSGFGFNTGNGDVYGIPNSRMNELNLTGSTEDNWYFYTFIFATQVQYNKIYIDNNNSETLSQITSTTNLTSERSFGITFRLGGWTNNESYTNNADYSTVMVYNRELTTDEILQNYNYSKYTYLSILESGLLLYLDSKNDVSYSGTGDTWYDLSDANNDATLINSPTYNNGVFYLNGTDEYINCGNLLPSTGDFTISVWFDTTFLEDRTSAPIIANDSNDIPGLFLVYPCSLYGTANYEIRVYADSQELCVGSDIRNSGYIYLTTTRSGDIISVYVNDEFDTSGTTSYSMDTGLYIGNTIVDTSDRHFKGNISVVQFYDRPLTLSEISRNYDITKYRFET